MPVRILFENPHPAATVRGSRGLRAGLETLLALIALNAFGGGLYGMLGARGVPRDLLRGSPFPDYFVPSLALFVLVGGSMSLAVTLLLRHHRLAREATFLAVLVLFGWLSIQLLAIGYVSPLQPAVAVAGLLALVLLFSIRDPREFPESLR